jgi:hypothetical protein
MTYLDHNATTPALPRLRAFFILPSAFCLPCGVGQSVQRLQVRVKAQGRGWEQAPEDGGGAGLTYPGAYCDVVSGMSVTIQLDLPDALVREAQANGLLESRPLGEILNEELLRERARTDLGRVLEELHSLPGEPMSPEEIQAEINAVRAQRRQLESGH